jgi:serine/threonine protein kinase
MRFSSPEPGGVSTADPSTVADRHRAAHRQDSVLPAHFGRYHTLRFLGAGGMGAVYLAEDPQLNRMVAVKVPRFAGHPSVQDESPQRFLREARAAAAIRHPRVCPIYDVGEQDGVPYVVMAFIEGCSLGERLKSEGRFTDPRAAAALVIQIADGLAAVHDAGLIHRDLKPANVLLDASGGAFLSDFGLARQLDAAEVLTSPGTLVGTVAYMAPEQADTSGRFGPVTQRTDIYSLGVVLYQVLTGHLPFKADSNEALLYQIVHGAQPSPRNLRPELDAGLERIVIKAMARQPQQRYADAREFAAALADYLRPWTRSTVRRSFDRPRGRSRKIWLAAAGLGGVVVLLSLWSISHFPGCDSPVQPPEYRQPPVRRSPRPGVANLERHEKQVRAVAFSPHGDLLATAGDDRSIRIWDVATGKRKQRIPHDSEVYCIAFSPDGETLAWGGADRSVTLLDLKAANDVKKRTIAAGGQATIARLAFAPDGKTIATVGYRQAAAILWDVRSGRERVALAEGHTEFINAVAFSPDSETVATASDDRTARLWNAATGTSKAPLKAHDRPVTCVAFSPDNQRLATGSSDQTIVIWSVASGAAIKPEIEVEDGVAFVGWTPDNRIVVTTIYDQVNIWNPSVNKSVIVRKHKNKGPIVSIEKLYQAHTALARDGRTLAYRDWLWKGDVHLLDLSQFIDAK